MGSWIRFHNQTRRVLYGVQVPRRSVLIDRGGRAVEFGKQCHVLPYSTMDRGELLRFSLLYLENVSVYEKFKICSIKSALATGIYIFAF